MKFLKKAIVTILAFAVVSQSAVFAQTFSDMPNNWKTGALERAVENGLLNGADGKIMPDDNITRAQMAAIIVRAFGATKEADISMFKDVSADKWYYNEFSKAVAMKAFAGTDEGLLNPDKYITYQECFTVMSRLLFMDVDQTKSISHFDASELDRFDDANQVTWAKQEMANIVGFGFWDGIDNKLKPNDFITRSEFAVLMDNIVKTYINEPGTYTDLPDGNVLIRSEGVTIDGVVTDDFIIVGDGVSGRVNLTNINSKNFIIGRGGYIKMTGVVNNISALCDGVTLDISENCKRTGYFYLMTKNTTLNIGEMKLGQ